MEEKDAWILTQANLTEESEAEDFIMSLTGEKKISYMPTELQIEEFCKKVQNGDIFVEYETHYYEFDSDGRYMDDWEVRHNDPQGAFSFLNRTFRDCHDLICLGEYDLAAAILNKILIQKSGMPRYLFTKCLINRIRGCLRWFLIIRLTCLHRLR